jgi:hypothetical protein
MDQRRLHDRLARGLGQAALRIGQSYDVFRPSGQRAPLSPGNRLIQLPVAFHGEDKDWHRSARYGQPLWFAVHDTSYTRPGDYLVGPAGRFFIAAQPAFLPTVCVLTNRVLSIRRAAGTALAGTNGYGGVENRDEEILLDGWPASVLTEASGPRTGGALPSEPGPAVWSVLLPILPEAATIEFRTDDLITDESGLTSAITAVEPSTLGWRLSMTQAVT